MAGGGEEKRSMDLIYIYVCMGRRRVRRVGIGLRTHRPIGATF